MDVSEFFYQFLPLFSVIILSFLISLVIRSDWRSFSYRIFSLFLFSMALWGFFIFLMRISTPHTDTALLWERFAIVFILATAVFFYHTTIVLTRTRSWRRLLPLFYLSIPVFAGLSFTKLIVEEIGEKSYGNAPEFGILFAPYLVAAYIPTFLGIANLVNAYLKSPSLMERNRYLYFLIGAAFSLVGATTDILAAQEVMPYPLGIVGNILFASATTVAILRLRLLELRVVLRRGMSYIILSTLIVGLYGGVFFLFDYLVQRQTDSTSARFLAALGAAMLVTILLQPILGRLQNIVDKWFYRERYDHLKELQRFSLETKDITDLDDIANRMIDVARKAMQANSACLMLPRQPSNDFVLVASWGLENNTDAVLDANSPLSLWMKNHSGNLTGKDLDIIPQLQAIPSDERDTLKQMGAELFIPLKAKDELTGILILGQKISERDYSSEDIDLLRTVANQAAMTIENARLYSQESQRLHELEKLEQLKSNLLLTVSHELKTPMTAIKAGTDMLAEQDSKDASSPKTRLIRSISRGVVRLEKLIDESLDYARMQSANLKLNLQPTDVEDLVQDVVGLISPGIKAKRQTLTVDVDPSLSEAVIDQARTERILLNVLSNAHKFTDKEGQIALKVGVDDGNVVFKVEDNGPGIASTEMDRIFEAYYRGENPDGKMAAGTGLGLSIAKYLVELHEGKIWLESKEGEGTTFYFSLPKGVRDEDTGD